MIFFQKPWLKLPREKCLLPRFSAAVGDPLHVNTQGAVAARLTKGTFVKLNNHRFWRGGGGDGFGLLWC